jgi:hypothetical protein
MDLALDRNFQVMSEMGLQYVCKGTVPRNTSLSTWNTTLLQKLTFAHVMKKFPIVYITQVLLIVTLVPSTVTRRMYNIQFVLLKSHVSTILSGHHQVNINALQVLY